MSDFHRFSLALCYKVKMVKADGKQHNFEDRVTLISRIDNLSLELFLILITFVIKCKMKIFKFLLFLYEGNLALRS
jgi:hypothetical protein